MSNSSAHNLKRQHPIVDLWLDTMSLQLELEKIQNLVWALSGTDEDPSFIIFHNDATRWVISPNGAFVGSDKSWLGRQVQSTASDGTKSFNNLVSAKVCVIQDALVIANLSVQAMSLASILLKVRIKLSE